MARARLAWLIPWALSAGACRAADDPSPPSAADLALVPVPFPLTIEAGDFELLPEARIAATAGAEGVGEGLAAVLRRATGWPLPVVAGPATAADIELVLEHGGLAGAAAEGYALTVSDGGVRIAAVTPAGLFYGCQTLRQLFPADIERAGPSAGGAWRVPHVTVSDAPRFAWRGTMLDVARHFFGVADVERFIELAAYHKLNRVHLHLTDDQGWRVEVPGWPALTTIGGAGEVGGGPGGYYTQADIAELVAYADARFVTLVPEVDMPGHVNAALASYAELNESGVAASPYTGTEVGFSTLWLAGPSTATFAADVVNAVAAQFPGPYLHIGGDEAKVTPAADYAAFLAALEPVVSAAQKTLVGWEEIGAAALSPPFLAQFWLSDAKALAARDRGAGIVASPAAYAYLDMKYDAATPIGQAYLGFTTVKKAYEWDPVLPGFADGDILGVEAPLWTETVASRADVELLAFPRLCGHAEIAWSSRAGRSWEEYRMRLARHGARLNALDVGFYRAPDVDWR